MWPVVISEAEADAIRVASGPKPGDSRGGWRRHNRGPVASEVCFGFLSAPLRD